MGITKLITTDMLIRIQYFGVWAFLDSLLVPRTGTENVSNVLTCMSLRSFTCIDILPKGDAR